MSRMLAIDVGGTFTDLVVKDEHGGLTVHKSPTTPHDPVVGVLEVLELAAGRLGISRERLLAETELLMHATTRGLNAVLTGDTARTALLTTRGHRDVLVFREGGRPDSFDHTIPYPQPYVSRALTFEVPERVDAQGDVVEPLDEAAVVALAGELREREVEAVAVCLLWSIVNHDHELRVGELLDEHLPGVPYTLSHQLNPTLREYRRASSSAIDASLKPVMSAYMEGLQARLEQAGFGGRVLIVTAAGGVLDVGDLAAKPIHSIGSGPAMAPVAGRHHARVDADADTAVVSDAGGTSYEVSLVRRGRIPWTRETWLGGAYTGHMTGFPSVDVRSIGAGGGSIAWVDEGGLLHVGPQSAGAEPGPVCYGRGGERPTVTDAALTLGYIDPEYFLGGALELDVAAARAAIDRDVAVPLGLDVEEAAAAVVRLASEHMVRAIEEITLEQGVDCRSATLVGGGGAAGLNAVAIARRLDIERVLFPQTAAALSAAGALMSDLASDYSKSLFTTSRDFDYDAVNAVLDSLRERCQAFFEGPGANGASREIALFAEARYPDQAWELEVPLSVERFAGPDDVEGLRQAFHATHREIFAVDDPRSPIEVVSWRARATVALTEGGADVPRIEDGGRPDSRRRAYWPDHGELEVDVRLFERMRPGESVTGPAIVESSVTTVVLDPGAVAERTAAGSLSIAVGSGDGNGNRQTPTRVGGAA
jgi:N-methylhydantoinase A